MGKPTSSHLLEFYGIDCDHCVDMEPLIQKLRDEENLALRRFEVCVFEEQPAEEDGFEEGWVLFFVKTSREEDGLLGAEMEIV